MVYDFRFEFRFLMWLPVFLTLLGTGGNCDRVEFYGKPNYEGDAYEFDLSNFKGCRSIFHDFINVKSVKTDRCLMLFGDEMCDNHRGSTEITNIDQSFSIRVDADTPEITAILNQWGTQILHSYSLCSRKYGGGPEVDVDFYGEKNYKGEITASYRDVCKCQNLETSAVGGKSRPISIDNFGQDIDFFEGKGCSGQKRSVKAGSNPETKWAWDLISDFDIRSFRPTDMDRCLKLPSSIQKFEFEDGSQEIVDDSTQNTVVEVHGKKSDKGFLKQIWQLFQNFLKVINH